MLPKATYSKELIRTGDAYRHISGERQRPPYDLYCAMLNWSGRVHSHRESPNRARATAPTASWAGYQQTPGSFQEKLGNEAYKRLVDKLGDASSLGATLTAERRETWGMVVNIVSRALSAARNIRKLNFGAAARDLGLPYHERVVVKRRRVKQPNGKVRTFKIPRKQFRWHQGRWYAKELGSGWLMYSYGIGPLMSDIYNCIDLLQREFPDNRFRGASKGETVVYDRWNRPGIFTSYMSKMAVSCSADVRVSNPNLWLANRLGLVNPAQWVLEAIPMSFVVDWFSNLSDVVMSMTDFVGLEVRKACTNSQRTVTQTTINYWSPDDFTDFVASGTVSQRSLSLPVPKLRFAYERFQWQRGANAISLLLQFLKAK